MGRLIDTNDIRVKPQYMQDIMGIAMIRCEDLSRILADVPTVEAIPKADYENRLKADMVAMLTDIQLEIEDCVDGGEGSPQFEQGVDIARCQVVDIVQQKIDALKEQTDET